MAPTPHEKPRTARLSQRLNLDSPANASSGEEQRESESEISARLSAMGENPSDLICELDRNCRFVYASANFRNMLHYKPAALLGRDMLELLHEEDARAVFAEVERLMVKEGSSRLLFRFRDARGEWRWLDSSVKAYRTAAGSERAILISRDVTEQRQAEEQRTLLAARDPATMLFTKQYLVERLIEAIDVARHRAPGALVYIDLDNFKQINDRCGHMGGDRLIVAVANLLHEAAPANSVVSRYGGDEFVLLLADTHLERAIRAAEAIREKLAGYSFVEGEERFAVSASVGVVGVDGSLNSRELLSQANAACASAKAQGGNRLKTLRSHAAGLNSFREAARRSEELLEALNSGRVELWYQPVIHIPTGAVDHEEALIRIRAAKDSVQAPAAFLASAERFGQMEILDRFVAGSAIDYLARQPEGRVAAILSGHAFEKPELTTLILDRLCGAGVEAERLIVQFPWAVVRTGPPAMRETLARLKAAGVRLGIKYFCADFDSVHRLRDFAVDYVKLDGELTRDFANSSLNRTTVSAINEIAHALRARTIAEFVDDEATLHRLQQIGIDYAKGSWIGVPRPGVRCQ